MIIQLFIIRCRFNYLKDSNDELNQGLYILSCLSILIVSETALHNCCTCMRFEYQAQTRGRIANAKHHPHKINSRYILKQFYLRRGTKHTTPYKYLLKALTEHSMATRLIIW